MFNEQVAIVTGGAGGLGSKTVSMLLNKGARIIVADMNENALESKMNEWSTMANLQRIRSQCTELTQRKDADALVRMCLDVWGRLDIVVNCAGGSYDTPLEIEKIEESHWQKVLDGNLKSSFLMCQAAAPAMKSQKYGRIVNIASIAGRVGGAITGVHYAAAKGGVMSLTKHLAQELGPYGITVNATAPGLSLSGPRLQNLWARMSYERKERTLSTVPVGRPSTVEEQASAIVFLASPEASYINGVILDVNGGRYSA